jgi:ribosomal protein L11 methyltransferase
MEADRAATVTAGASLSEAVARRVFDALAESFDSDRTAVAVSDNGDGRWTISLHFKEVPSEAAARVLIALAAAPEIANAFVFETRAARDWVKTSLAGLTPVAAGRFLVHGAHDRARVPPNRIGIEIEAALAFGTGHHASTRGCLLALDRIVRQAKPWRPIARVLDLGTGSGVLAIAAARALRQVVLATDNDPRAVTAARVNSAKNHAGGLIAVIRADGLKARRLRERAPFDLILANILLAPLKAFAAPMARLIGSNGTIVLSGVLATQANAALAAYRPQGLTLERRLDLEGWTTLVLRRPCCTIAGRRPRQ